MLIVFIYAPRKHQKIRGGIERDRGMEWVHHIVLSAIMTTEDLVIKIELS